MKYISFLLLFGIIAAYGQSSSPVTVKYVDLKKYAGLWYEIAKIPNTFQKHCVKNTTAEYFLNEDGSIKVINSCTDEDGDRDEAEGVAEVFDKSSNAKLEVSFVSFLGIRPFWGDYWIIGLDSNYEYAVIGVPNRKYGWILSRNKKMTDDQLSAAFDIIKRNGYDVKKFVMSEQE